MEIVYRVGATYKLEEAEVVREKLRELGVKANFTGELYGSVLLYFDLSDAHPRYEEVRALMDALGLKPTSKWLKFTPEEIAAARWLSITAFPQGYPYPDDIYEYVKVTYDTTEWCPKCGVGAKQNAPFRMRREPQWGKRHDILRLHWVDDALFTRPEVWERVFKPFGIGCMPVLNARGTAELQTVVQLVVEEHVGLSTEGLEGHTCPECGRVKYREPLDFLPTLLEEPSGAMAMSREWFGSGGAAYHLTLVSQTLWQAMVSDGVRGITGVTPLRS